MKQLMDDREYTQDEGETVDLVVWEEWVNSVDWASCGRSSHPNNEDRCCTDSQQDKPLTD